MSGAVSNQRTAISRCLSLCLALFIFSVTALVHLTHDKSDFLSVSCEPASYASSDAQSNQVCFACMIVKAFQTAQAALLILLAFIASVAGFNRFCKSDFHSSTFLFTHWVRGPPLPFSFPYS